MSKASAPKARTLTLTEAELREHLPGFAEMCDELDTEHPPST